MQSNRITATSIYGFTVLLVFALVAIANRSPRGRAIPAPIPAQTIVAPPTPPLPNPPPVQRISLTFIPGHSGISGRWAISQIIVSNDGSLIRKAGDTTTTDRIALEDFRRVENLLDRTHFFETNHFEVALDFPYVQIEAERGARRHTISDSFDFEGAPRFRSVVTGIVALSKKASNQTGDSDIGRTEQSPKQ